MIPRYAKHIRLYEDTCTKLDLDQILHQNRGQDLGQDQGQGLEILEVMTKEEIENIVIIDIIVITVITVIITVPKVEMNDKTNNKIK